MHTNNPNSQTSPWYHPPATNQPFPLPPFVYLFAMQQLLGLQANTMPWSGVPMQQFSPFYVEPVYQGMAPRHQHQHQYRPPNSGPSYNQRSKGQRKTEARYPNQLTHESSGMIIRDHSTGINPGMASMGAINNAGAGRAWRPPSGNQSLVDRNSTRQMQITPYERDRARHSRTRRKRRDKVRRSVYEIPRGDPESATAGQSNVPHVIPALAPSILSTSVPALSPSAPPTSTPASLTSTTQTNAQEQPVEDDFDTISLGSDTDYQY